MKSESRSGDGVGATPGAGFPASYTQARTTFLESSVRAGVAPQSFVNPAQAPVELATDSAYFGAPDALRVLVVTSGVHGTELLGGSGCQSRLIERGVVRDLPADTGMLLVHAINPWGAVHWRRNTEDNVDLCRNFVDFRAPLPTNPAYARVRPALDPPGVEQVSVARAAALIASLQRDFGPRDFMNGLMAGQYVDPTGFSFGGSRETWSRRVLLDLLRRHTSRAQQVCIIDLHTGLGPYGYGMAVCLHRGEALARARRWFGHWIFAPRDLPPDSPEGLFDVTGHCSDGYEDALDVSRVTAVVLEFGTYPTQRVFPALIQDHWLTALGDPPGPQLERIRREMREIHYPDDPEWRESAWERTHQIVRQALAGLQEWRGAEHK